MEKNKNVGKDTEKWVEEQNAFFEKKRVKQRDAVLLGLILKGL